ncbi:two-component-system connector protein SafA [Escherichia coli]|nr:two-component-system connector protein SafA [Escherichia coli]EGO4346158.1 two-component-system connector protein SafA [Escherichia coli]
MFSEFCGSPLIAIFSAIDQLSISKMGRIARDLTHFIINSLQG